MPPPPTQWATLAARPAPTFLPRSGRTALPLPTRDGFLLSGGYTEIVSGATTPPVRAPTAEAWTVRLGPGGRSATTTPAPPGPPPRLAAAGATVGDTAWLIGGWDPGSKGDGGTILADVWSCRLGGGGGGGGAWTPHPGAALPAPASRHCTAAVPGGSAAIIIVTHRCGETVLRLDVSDPAAPALGSVKCAPDPAAGYPPPRGLSTLVALESDGGGTPASSSHDFLLFGGAPRRGGMDSDLWRLTIAGDAGQWRRVGGGGDVGTSAWPPPRCSHVAAALPGGMVVWGGSYYAADGGGLVARGDARWWDEGEGVWAELSPVGDAQPLPRNAAAAAAAEVEEEGGATRRMGILVAGGWDPFRVTYRGI